MRSILFIAIGFAVSVMASCKKDGTSGSIAGNWAVVSDSTSSSGIGPNGTPSGNKYIGVAGDHFDFTSAGKLYVNEGGFKIDTAQYTITGTRLSLEYSYLHVGDITVRGSGGGYDITTLSRNSLVLTEDALTPGGRIYEQIILTK